MRFPQFTVAKSLLTITAAFSILSSGVSTAGATDSSVLPLVVKQHTTPNGQQYFAVAVKPTDVLFSTVRRHVVLMDTSASQTGTIRESSLALVSRITAELSPQSQLQILAIDTQCVPMTDGFVPTTSREVNDALQQLSLRTPLGATNLKSAFTCILAAADQQPTSVVYIGDGMTSRDVIMNEELQTLLAELADRNISVHSLVLGPRTSLTLPGILANRTGGTVATVKSGHEAVAAQTVALALTVAPVTAQDFAVDGQPLSITGSQSCFLRPDRHTVLHGQGSFGQFRKITARTQTGTTTWTADNSSQVNGGPELKQFVDRITASHGTNAPITSLEDLNVAEARFTADMQQSLAAADFLERRGNDLAANNYRKQVATLTGFVQPPAGFADDAVTPAPQPPAAEFEPLEAAPSPFADEPPLPAEAGEIDAAPVPKAQTEFPPESNFGAPEQNQFPAAEAADPLNDVETAIQLQTQILVSETNQAIENANDLGFEQPDYAISLLKDTLETIKASNDISQAVRNQLETRIVRALSGVQNRKDVNAQMQRQAAIQEAVLESQKATLQEEKLEEERLAILIDQVRGLLQHGRHGDTNGFEDGETVSRIALNVRPGNGPATQALVMSESLGQLSKAYNLVNLRHDRFLEVLYQVELSHVPFPDEPPIQYPPADVWRSLSLTRIPRYESVDLRIEKPVEKWLRQMLDKPIPPLDFPGPNPLKEILDTIEAFYTTTYGAGGGASGTDFRMTIYPDLAELDLEGITSLEDIEIRDIRFEGMTLRNALQLIFDQTSDPELTYVIENEVFKITTLAKAESEENLVTRVYPVADLVIPPVDLGGGGQGQAGGLGGGQQGGGLNQGQQGGGGGGGGFGGGGGGGFMSVPDDLLKQMQNAAQNGISTEAIKQLKKKPAGK